MHASLNRMDIVCERQNSFREIRGVPDRDLHLNIIQEFFNVDRRAKRLFSVRHLVNVGHHSSFKIILIGKMRPLVIYFYPDTPRQIRLLAKVIKNSLKIQVQDREYLAIRSEINLRSPLPGVGRTDTAYLFDLAFRFTARVFLDVNISIPSDLRLERLGKRVDHGYADPMQSA